MEGVGPGGGIVHSTIRGTPRIGAPPSGTPPPARPDNSLDAPWKLAGNWAFSASFQQVSSQLTLQQPVIAVVTNVNCG